jgi:hypothetical protein
MNLKHLFFILLPFVVACGGKAAAAAPQGCAVTRPSDRGFVPPPYNSAKLGNDEFFWGTPALWRVICSNWHIHSGGKLPYFRKGYNAMKEKDPRLVVVARRLDKVEPMVWNGWANMAGAGGGGDFMVRHVRTVLDRAAFGVGLKLGSTKVSECHLVVSLTRYASSIRRN